MSFDPTVADVQFSSQMSDVSVSWMQKNENFIFNQGVFPQIPVDDKTGQYIEMSRSDFYRDDVIERVAAEEPPITGHGITRHSYNCRVWQIAGMVDDMEKAAAAPPYEGLAAKTRQITQQQLIHADVRWASTFFTTSVWGTDLTGVASGATAGEFNQWDDASSNPITQIDEQKAIMLRDTGFEPNTLVCGYNAWLALKENASIVSRWQAGPPAAGGSVILNEQIMAGLLGLKRVVVSKATRTTSNKGAATATFGMILGTNDALLLYAADSPGKDVPTAGYTFVWKGFLGTGSVAPVFTGRKSFNFADWVACFMAYDYRIVAPQLGVFFNEAAA